MQMISKNSVKCTRNVTLTQLHERNTRYNGKENEKNLILYLHFQSLLASNLKHINTTFTT